MLVSAERAGTKLSIMIENTHACVTHTRDIVFRTCPSIRQAVLHWLLRSIYEKKSK